MINWPTPALRGSIASFPFSSFACSTHFVSPVVLIASLTLTSGKENAKPKPKP
jgi:hypothetical protein